MVPEIYEKLAHERLQILLREAEHQRLLAERQQVPPTSLQRFAARPGLYLIAAGTRLQHSSTARLGS